MDCKENMQPLNKIDEQTPIEQYPGYLGHVWENEYMHVIKELSFLTDIPIRKYKELADYADEPNRHINVKFSANKEKILIEFDIWNEGLGEILDHAPSIEVCFDDLADIFFLKDGHKLEEAINDMKQVAEALIADYNNLEIKHM
jgi:hypothetical protein